MPRWRTIDRRDGLGTFLFMCQLPQRCLLDTERSSNRSVLTWKRTHAEFEEKFRPYETSQTTQDMKKSWRWPVDGYRGVRTALNVIQDAGSLVPKAARPCGRLRPSTSISPPRAR